MKKGQITIYLALVMTIMISMLLGIIEGARATAMQLVLECAVQNAMQSVFAEYHRELYERYDLLFVDTSYGQETGSVHNMENHFVTYLQYNLDPGREVDHIGYSDWFAIRLQSAEAQTARLATDTFGLAILEQGASYMRDKIGMEGIANIADVVVVIEENDLTTRDIGSEFDEYCDELEDEMDEENSLASKVWKETKLYKEWQKPFHSMELEVLRWITDSEHEISTQMIDIRNYPTGRFNNAGTTTLKDLGMDDYFDSLFFNEYIVEKCGSYVKNTEDMHLKYQTEYVINGGFADDINLETVVNTIFAIRCAANGLSIMNDSNKKEQAQTVSLALCTLLAVPEAEEIVTNLILLTWAIGESGVDMKDIMSNERVPLIKKSDQWKLSLDGFTQSDSGEPLFPELADSLSSGKEAEELETAPEDCSGKEETVLDGLCYEDYLRVLLFLVPIWVRVVRCMDIMEMDIRKTNGNEFFRLDECMDEIEFEVVIDSEYGQTYMIKRKYSYL